MGIEIFVDTVHHDAKVICGLNSHIKGVVGTHYFQMNLEFHDASFKQEKNCGLRTFHLQPKSIF